MLDIVQLVILGVGLLWFMGVSLAICLRLPDASRSEESQDYSRAMWYGGK